VLCSCHKTKSHICLLCQSFVEWLNLEGIDDIKNYKRKKKFSRGLTLKQFDHFVRQRRGPPRLPGGAAEAAREGGSRTRAAPRRDPAKVRHRQEGRLLRKKLAGETDVIIFILSPKNSAKN
jgi:hypothetical protein